MHILSKEPHLLSQSDKADSPVKRGLRALVHNPLTVVCIVVIALWILVALNAQVITPYDPLVLQIENRLSPPSAQHIFGTDEIGRDVFSRVIYGSRISIFSGLVVIAIVFIIGSLIGALAGFRGGVFDLLIMRLADVTMAFPHIVLAMAIAAVLGPSLKNAMIAMIMVWWPEYARLMRGQVLAIRENEYVTAAQSVGATDGRVLFQHILPNALSPCIIKASLDVGLVILFISALSFIGLGVVPPTPEWGSMISSGRFKFYSWWLTTFPGLAMLSVVMALNLIGDGIRDAFDPKAFGR